MTEEMEIQAKHQGHPDVGALSGSMKVIEGPEWKLECALSSFCPLTGSSDIQGVLKIV